jgi:dTDP-4-dehydrorhamnose reductase
MRVFISGASGLVGHHCKTVFEEALWPVMGTYFSFPVPGTVYYNTLEPNHPNNAPLLEFKPDVLVHCGALTHVDYCETNEEESYQKTVQSTLNIIQTARACGAKIVYLSTDYVFDGQAGPYSETDTVNPLSVYAKHKLAAEQAVLQEPNSLVLRITNVYGTEVRNKNFVARILSQLAEGLPITLKLPFDQYATPVNAHDVARALQLLLRDNQTGIFHIASTDWMNRVELAQRVLQYFPQQAYTLETFSTNALQQAAPRPLLGGLLKTKFSALYPAFQFTNVDDFVKEQMALKNQSV